MNETRRRRLTVRRPAAVAVVALMLGIGWWLWPRADQRLLGTWAVTTNLYDKSELLSGKTQPSVRTTLNSSGTGFTTGPGGGCTFYWTVINNKFISTSSDWPGLGQVELVYHCLTGRILGVADIGVEHVVKVTPDEFVLDCMDTWEGHDEEWRTEFEGQPPTFYTRLPK